MKVIALKSVNFMEWLLDKEEEVLDTIALEEIAHNLFSIEKLEKELQTIRELKEFVVKYEGGEHECC